VSLPYRWHPSGTVTKPLPAVGDLVGWEHGVWRVVDVRPTPEVDWSPEDHAALAGIKLSYRQQRAPHHVQVEPIGGGNLRHLRCGGRIRAMWDVYTSEHWPACGKCHEPTPCREVVADQMIEQASRQLERWSTPGVCPNCEEPVSARQRSQTFRENLRVPGGPPVTFHVGRGGCAYAARQYAEKLPGGSVEVEVPLW
jgi:hypothetical protein